MKKGYVINDNLDLIQANYSMVYAVGMFGKERDPLFVKYWTDIQPDKRGIIHRPMLGATVDEYDNASAFKWLLDDLGYSNWNNGNPLIVDIWEATGDTRFDMDHIRVYGQYVTNNFKPKVKPLLRLNIATWDAYLKNNRTEAIRLLTNWELLLLQPFTDKPASLTDYGVPAWWEYDFNFIACDVTKLWLQSPNPIPAPVDPTQPPETDPQPEPIQPAISIPKKWKISLFGGLIKGTIEAVEE